MPFDGQKADTMHLVAAVLPAGHKVPLVQVPPTAESPDVPHNEPAVQITCVADEEPAGQKNPTEQVPDTTDRPSEPQNEPGVHTIGAELDAGQYAPSGHDWPVDVPAGQWVPAKHGRCVGVVEPAPQ
jgi:hypothetical protein